MASGCEPLGWNSENSLNWGSGDDAEELLDDAMIFCILYSCFCLKGEIDCCCGDLAAELFEAARSSLDPDTRS